MRSDVVFEVIVFLQQNSKNMIIPQSRQSAAVQSAVPPTISTTAKANEMFQVYYMMESERVRRNVFAKGLGKKRNGVGNHAKVGMGNHAAWATTLTKWRKF